jgi:hypothetical protein
MRGGFRRERRARSRVSGCLFLILGLIIVLVILSVLFGGFTKGTKTGSTGPAAPVPVSAGR